MPSESDGMKLLILFIFFSATAQAESLFDRRLSDGRYVYDVLIQQGVPETPLDLLFRLFDYNEGRIPNTTYAVLVDYSLPSIEKRMYLMNLRTAGIQRFHVAHGIRTGILQARVFSNLFDSWRSSLGFFLLRELITAQKMVFQCISTALIEAIAMLVNGASSSMVPVMSVRISFPKMDGWVGVRGVSLWGFLM